MADKETIGIVGVGRMGQAMVRHLIKHGYTVLAHDIEPKALTTVRALGALAFYGARVGADIAPLAAPQGVAATLADDALGQVLARKGVTVPRSEIGRAHV